VGDERAGEDAEGEVDAEVAIADRALREPVPREAEGAQERAAAHVRCSARG
jgi:hypothetical protein